MPRPATCPDVIAEVERIGVLCPDRTVFVGVDGFGAAGKSRLASAIAGAVPRAVVVHVDDFARPGVPEWEWDRFNEQVARPLREGAASRYLVWNWGRDSPGDWLTIGPGRIVVIEGVSSTRSDVALDWDLTIWVAAPPDVRLRRAIERDGEQMRSTWLELWMPPEQLYAERERPQERVDLLVDGTA